MSQTKRSVRFEDGSFLPGVHIRVACDQLVSDANATGVIQTASFNGIELVAKPFITTAKFLSEYWNEESNKRSAEYRAKVAAEEQAKLDEVKAGILALVEERDSLAQQLAAVREENAKLREAAELVLQHALPCEDLRHRLPQRVAFEMLRAALSQAQEPQT